MIENGSITPWGSAWNILWTLSPEGNIASSSSKLETLTGCPNSAWQGESLLSLIHPDDVPVVARHLRSAAEGESQAAFELRIRLTEGTPLMLEAAIARLPGEGPSHRLAVVARDLTERHRAAALLREKEDRFQDLVEGTRAVPFEADCLQRCYTYVGPQAFRLLGYPPEEWLVGDFWMQHIHPADRRLVEHFPISPLVETPDQEFVYRMIAADGRTVWLLHLARRQPGARLCRGFLLDVTDRHEALAEVQRSRAQQRALVERLQLAREEERLCVAREIHDELGQSLTYMRMSVLAVHNDLQKLAERESAAVAAMLPRIEMLEQLATETMRSVRRIATQLRPPVLDRIGLFAAIEWQAGDFEKHFGIRCHLERSQAEPVLEPDRAAAVFRIFQEVLTNVAKHAQATEVRVSLRSDRRAVLLQVIDDGKGITATDLSKPDAFGVLGMRERAAAFHGILEVTPSKRGTVVMLIMPFRSAELGEAEKLLSHSL